MNAIGYIRISTEDQSVYSIDNQERAIRDYCARNKLDLKAIFTDNGSSSYTFDRPDYIALEAFIKKNKDVKFLIYFEHDRFSRNLAEALLKINELEQKFKIRVYASSDAFDADFADPNSFMMRAFKFMLAEGELHNIRKRTRENLMQGTLSGRFMRKAPYGYKNARDPNKMPILVVVEAQATIVRFVYREFLQGVGVDTIHREAKKLGYTQEGKVAIRRILSNAVYCGLIPVPAYKGRKSLHVQGLHTPIVSEQEYWLVQEKLVNKPKTPPKNAEVPLRGVLRCWCGRKLSAGNSRSKTGAYHWYYLCPEHRQNLPAKKLHPQFERLLDRMSISPERMAKLRARLESDIKTRLAGQEKATHELERDLKVIEIQIKTAERKYLMGNVREETYESLMADLRGTEVRLRREITMASTEGGVLYAQLEILLPTLANVRQSFESLSLERQHRFLESGFDNGLSYSDGSYRTHFLHPGLSANLHALQEEGLLIIEKPVKNLRDNPRMGRSRGPDRTLDDLLELLQLIA